MATTVDTLLVRIEADMSDLKRDLNRISQQTEQQTNKMAASFRRVGTALAAIGGAAALGGLIKGFIQTGAEVENLAVRFNTLFGSAEKGAEAFQAITRYASEVPFSLQDIQRGAAPLATIVGDANQMGDALKLTGNIAAASGMSFEEASQNIQRALSAGINSADMFRERGVSAMAGFQAGTSYSVEETLEKLQSAFGAGGEYDGITNDLAKTTDGAVSMLGDSLFAFQRTVAESGANAGFRDLINALKQFMDEIRPVAVVVGNVLGKAFSGLAFLVALVSKYFDELKRVAIAFLAVQVASHVMDMVKAMHKLAAVTLLNRNLFKSITRHLLKNPFGFVAMGAILLAEKTGVLEKAFDALEEKFPTLFGGLGDVATGLEENDLDGLNDLKEAMKDMPRLSLGGSEGQDIAGTGDALANLNSIINGTRTSTEGLNSDISLLEAHLLATGENALPFASEALQRLKDELAQTLPEIQMMNSAISQFSVGVSQSLADALVSGQDFASSFKSMFDNLVKQIIAKAIELFVVNQIMNSIFGGVTGFSPLPSGQLFGAAGGGTIQPNTPTLVGERGPELFVPSGAGKIMNNMNTQNALGGGGVTVNQTIQIETGVSQTVRAEMLSLLPVIKEDTINAVADSRRRGGSFAQAFS